MINIKKIALPLAIITCFCCCVVARTGDGISNIFAIDNNCGYSNIFEIDNLLEPIPGDFTLDGIVDERDLEVLASQWLSQPGNPSADIAPPGGDNLINFLDFIILTEHWLE